MRLLLAIGCNRYDAQEAQDLSHAESDAQRMFAALRPETAGDYSREASILLLSPTMDDVRAALKMILSEREQIDTFTFFFAGHGSVRAGSFYMWVRDSSTLGLSMTAFPLADLFRAVNEVKPAQTNIIIDACESGGLINDLSVLLKSEALGNANTPGITLLATSAQDESAYEDIDGGVGTSAILDCIEGRELVQDHSPTLDLVEIGRNVSVKLRQLGQSPVVWGLNLFGAPQFCRNPFSDSDRSTSMRILVKEWSANLEHSLRDHSDRLWAAYASVDGDWNPRAFSSAIEPILAKLSPTPDTLARFIERLGAAVLERAESAQDPYRSAEVSAVLAVGLLPYLTHKAVIDVARHFVDLTSSAISDAGLSLEEALSVDDDALLLKGGFGFSELFYLPLRLAKVMAWGAVPGLLTADGSEIRKRAVEQYGRLVGSLLSKYEPAIVAVSDAQAPCWCVALALQYEFGMGVDAERIAGLIYYSLVKNGCHLVSGDASSTQILEYLLALNRNDFSHVSHAIERPNETLTVLMRAAQLLKLGDVFDEDLWHFDGTSFMAYFCENYENFGARSMPSGSNLVWQVGSEIFSVEELSATWPEVLEPSSDLYSVLTIFASLLYPDRIPWHVLRNEIPMSWGVGPAVVT